MRLWHYKLLPYLPDAQFKGQLRELVAILHDWRDKGQTNHLLINLVMQYPKTELLRYFTYYCHAYESRYRKVPQKDYLLEFRAFADMEPMLFTEHLYAGWHDKKYLRVCMANLFEKYFFGVGGSKITEEEWQRLLQGYRDITGEDYCI